MCAVAHRAVCAAETAGLDLVAHRYFSSLATSLFRCACRIAGNKKTGAFCKAPGRKQTDLLLKRDDIIPVSAFLRAQRQSPVPGQCNPPGSRTFVHIENSAAAEHQNTYAWQNAPFFSEQTNKEDWLWIQWPQYTIPNRGCQPLFCRFYQILRFFFSKVHKRRSAKSSTQPPGKACGVLLLFFKEVSWGHAQFFRP